LNVVQDALQLLQLAVVVRPVRVHAAGASDG